MIGFRRRARLRVDLRFAAALVPVLTALSPAAAIAYEAPPPIVAAAADLKFALTEIAERFEADTGGKIQLNFGSSGNFATQIEQGAPFQLFLSADESYVRKLAGKGLTADDGVLYAIGRIALFAPTGSPIVPDTGLAGLKAAIAAGTVTHFAIANPEHAPYGRAAEQALRSQGLWDMLELMLVRGENASQAAQFASSGSTEGGIIPYSLALAPEVSKLGSVALLPSEWHEPLRQRMVLLKGAGETAVEFYDYLQRPAAREIFRRFGFLLPSEAS